MADSDSENEGILNNIQRLVIRPPGHTGKAKKGHICFDGGYETMNMGRVDFITNQEYDLFIRPDTANPRERLWFHFTVENTRKDQRVIFNVVNLSKWRTLFGDGLTPVVKSTSRPRWQRMQRQFVFYYESPLHSDHFVLSFAFSFDREDERYSFALAQPFSLSRYNLYLEAILAAQHSFLRCETIGRTIQERPIQLLTITDLTPAAAASSPSNAADRKQRKKIVFIMGRSHASEAPSSFIMQGLIDFLVSSHEVAQDLRKHLIFKLVPMMNPDGVFLGNTMGNLLGQDLNRHWHEPDRFLHPGIHAVRQLIHSYDREHDLDMILDVHSHISLLGLFVVGNSYDDVYRFERHVVFPKILSQICPDFSLDNTIYNDDEAKAGSARRYFCSAVSPEVNSFTLEASLYGYIDPESDPLLPVVVPYTDDMYCRIGRNLARAMWDYYKILNVIPLLADQEGGTERGEGTLMANSLRSFNLLRLKAIIDQRNQAAITFDSANAAAAAAAIEAGQEVAATPLAGEGIKSSMELHRKTAKGGFYHGQVYLSVKNVVFSPELLYQAEKRPRNRYIYDYRHTDESLEADDEADLEDLLSLSIVDLNPTNISYIRAGLNTSTQQRVAPTSNPLLPGKRGQQKTRRSTLHGSDGLSVRGQNYASWSFGRDDTESKRIRRRRRRKSCSSNSSSGEAHLMPPPTTTSESFLSGACGLRDHHQHRRRPSSSASGGNSYYGRGAYADPRCEMKKRQQQEIVVSGLTINTSDISSGEEEEEEGEAKAEKDKGNLTNACSSFLVADEMSLIEETSVRKVGGGGALSTSIFQSAAPRPQSLRPCAPPVIKSSWRPELSFISPSGHNSIGIAGTEAGRPTHPPSPNRHGHLEL